MKGYWLAALSLLWMTCASDSTPPLPYIASAGTAPPTVDEALARAVLEEVNALRASGCQCPGGRYFKPSEPLRWDTTLAQAAKTHAEDMRLKRYFDHTSADGTDFADRITRAGYTWQSVGENIAKGQPTARAVVQAWKASKYHCSNMMNRHFQDMGVGKAGPYWVQDFGRKK